MENTTAENVYAGGGTRSTDNKPDYEGMLSPIALQFYAEYMFFNSFINDGSRRNEDNWQMGIPLSRWLKSLFRHMFALQRAHKEKPVATDMDRAFSACAVIFNGFGYLHEFVKAHPELIEQLQTINADKLARLQNKK